MDIILQLRSPHISLSLTPFLRAIICTIRRFLTCERSRYSDRGLRAVLNPSELSLMTVSGLFSSAPLCNYTSEPSDAPGRVCATFWLAQGIILFPLFSLGLPAWSCCITHDPETTETLNKKKQLCVNPNSPGAEYTSVWNKAYRVRR